jgi:predicted dinucleotide-binding enzyme
VNVTILGAGPVGRTLGAGWARAGHQVRYGVREPGKHQDLPLARPVPYALDDPDAPVVLAVPGRALPELLDACGPHLDGRLVIDATNTVGGPDLHQLPPLTARLPRARLARAFCTVGVEVMAEPVIGGDRADLFWCGPDGADGKQVARLAADLGFRPVRIGDLGAGGTLDGVTRLWFALTTQGWTRHHALRTLGPHR